MTACASQTARFYTLNQAQDWASGFQANLESGDRGLSLPMTAQVTPEDALRGLPPDLEACSLASASCGKLYLLDRPTGILWLYTVGSGHAEAIDCLRPLTRKPCAVAAHRETFFLADLRGREGERLLCLDRRDWQVVWIAYRGRDGVGGPIGLDGWTPISLCPLPDGGVAVLSAAATKSEQSGREMPRLEVLEFDRRGRLNRVSGGGELAASRPLTVPQMLNRLALGADSRGQLWVLDSTAPRIHHLPAPETAREPRPVVAGTQPDLALRELDIQPRGFAVDSRGNLFVGDGSEMAEETEDPRLIWIFEPSTGRFQPLPGYRGAAHLLQADALEQLYIADLERRRFFRLLRAPTSSSRRVRPPGRGTFVSLSFDGGEDELRWHRLTLRLKRPDSHTRVRVSYRSADQRQVPGIGDLDDFLSDQHWREDEKAALIEAIDDWTPLGDNPSDALLQGPGGRAAQGRYLWLKVELTGSEKASPRVESLRVEYPRRSLLRYLPRVYQRDLTGERFLERFLALFESFFRENEERIEQMARYFDPQAVSGDFLRWLASWVALAAQRDWSDQRLRMLIQRSSELYPIRGTPRGILEIVEILSGESAFLVEAEDLDCAQGDARQALERLFGNDPYTFWLLLPATTRPSPQDARQPMKPRQEWDPQRKQRVLEIVESVKPAHTEARVETLHQRIVLGGHSYLEYNSRLAEPNPTLDQGAGLGRDTLLTGQASRPGQLERGSRVGRDTRLT